MEVTNREIVKVRVNKELAEEKRHISRFLNWCKLMGLQPTEKALDVYMSTLSLSMESLYEVQDKVN